MQVSKASERSLAGDMHVDRRKITSIRQLALTLSDELNKIAHDLGQAVLDTQNDTVNVISTLASAIDAIRDDTAEYYQEQYDKLAEEFFKYEPIA